MIQRPAREGVRDKPVGVFSLRTPPRSNPIAAQSVDILAVRDGELDVVGLDCLDGTPLLDIKRTKRWFSRPGWKSGLGIGTTQSI
jgi:tRNA (Thr-GGU) A37 N-methylase